MKNLEKKHSKVVKRILEYPYHKSNYLITIFNLEVFKVYFKTINKVL